MLRTDVDDHERILARPCVTKDVASDRAVCGERAVVFDPTELRRGALELLFRAEHRERFLTAGIDQRAEALRARLPGGQPDRPQRERLERLRLRTGPLGPRLQELPK